MYPNRKEIKNERYRYCEIPDGGTDGAHTYPCILEEIEKISN